MGGDRLADFGRLGDRNTDRQHGAGAVAPVAGIDATALRLDKTATDREPEARPGAPPVLCLDPVKLVEDAFEIAGRNPRTLVADLDRHDLAVAKGADLDPGSRRGIFGGV